MRATNEQIIEYSKRLKEDAKSTRKERTQRTMILLEIHSLLFDQTPYLQLYGNIKPVGESIYITF